MSDEDADSEVALVRRRDDESLSSVDDELPQCAVQVKDVSHFWGSSTSSLYRSMKELAITSRTTCCRLPTPSALKADQQSMELLQMVETTVLPKYGTTEKQEQWNNATKEQKLEWIASFFMKEMPTDF